MKTTSKTSLKDQTEDQTIEQFMALEANYHNLLKKTGHNLESIIEVLAGDDDKLIIVKHHENEALKEKANAEPDNFKALLAEKIGMSEEDLQNLLSDEEEIVLIKSSSIEESKGTETVQDLKTVVIPFVQKPAVGNELQYAVRAWEKNYPSCQIIIVGDYPKWGNKSELLHIPVTQESNNPQIDVANKLMAAIASELVPEEFIWSNDDIYPTTPILASDVRLQTAHGELVLDKRNTVYAKNKKRTIARLLDSGFGLNNYATHSPVVFEKEKLAEILETFNCLEEGHLISSLYFNVLYPNHIPVFVDNSGREKYGNYTAASVRSTSLAMIEKSASRIKFLNNTDAGWLSVLPFLKKVFKSKSIFEK